MEATLPDTGPNYSLPPGYFVQSGDTILPSQHNPIFEDVAAAMNARMMRNGTAPMTGNLQMGSKQITGLAAASQPHHAPRFDQITPKTAWLTSVSGLSLAANEMVFASGANTAAKTTLTAFARTLLGAATQGAGRDILGAAASGRLVSAGSGLVGGGGLDANVTIQLGIPSSITHDSTNSRTDTSHTHAISEETIRLLMAQGTAGQVGTYAMLRITSSNGVNRAPNFTAPGSDLYYANAAGSDTGQQPGGTWRLMGHISPSNDTTRTSTWLRIV